MDATKRPLKIPPEISTYAERHGIFDLYKRLLTELVISKPDDPLDFMIEFFKRDDDDVPRIVVLGPPAAGKGSISRMLSKALGAIHITVDSLLTGADSNSVSDVQQYIDSKQPVPHDLWAKLVHSRLQLFDAVKKGWILDSIIETRDQALSLSMLGIYPKHCVLLEAPDTVLIERASGKRIDPETGDIYHVTFDWPTAADVADRLVEVPECNDEEVARQLVIYHRNITGVKRCYEHVTKTINADQPKVDVFSQVMSYVCQPVRSAAPHTPRVVLIGPRGSGCHLMASLLADKYRLADVCCGKLIKQEIAAGSSTGLACKPHVDKGLPVPDAIVLHIIKDRLSQLDCVTNGWVLHGFPRTRDQAEALMDAGYEANRVFFMDISNEAILERLSLRATDPKSGNHYHLLYNPPRTQEIKDRLHVCPKDNVDTITAQLAEFHSQREELFDYYRYFGCQRVNADQDVHTVFETLESIIVNPLPKCTTN